MRAIGFDARFDMVWLVLLVDADGPYKVTMRYILLVETVSFPRCACEVAGRLCSGDLFGGRGNSVGVRVGGVS